MSDQPSGPPGAHRGPPPQGLAASDIQRRLASLGLTPGSTGVFDTPTAHAIESFQIQRGLVVTGECDDATWAALVEAGFRLGDRLLYLTRPMQRGDDVADLQQRLGGMGFDAGHIDGIFGPDTDQALREFQYNSGITRDGVCGPATLDHLARVSNRIERPATVAGVRARQRLRDAPRNLAGWRVAVTHAGGADVIANAVVRHLAQAGGQAIVIQHRDPSTVAGRANEFDAGAVIELELGEPPAWCAFYRSGDFESPGGRRLAEILTGNLEAAGLAPPPPRGMQLVTLRETRMPAVVVHLAPVPAVVTDTSGVAGACASAFAAWVASPLDPET